MPEWLRTFVFASKGSGFHSQHWHGDPHLFVTLALGDLMPSCGLSCIHMVHRHTGRQNNHTHKVKIKFQKGKEVSQRPFVENNISLFSPKNAAEWQVSPRACWFIHRAPSRAHADPQDEIGESIAQTELWVGLSFSSLLSLAAMEMRDVPLAEMPGHLVSSFLGKRRLRQEAPLHHIWSLVREFALPLTLPHLIGIFSTSFCLYSAHVPRKDKGQLPSGKCCHPSSPPQAGSWAHPLLAMAARNTELFLS